MAVEKTIVIKADTKQAEKSFEDLGDIIQEQTDITIEFEKELAKLERQLKDTPKGSLGAQKNLKTQITQIKDALKDQRVSLRSLRNEQKKAGKTNTDYTAGLKKTDGIISAIDSKTGGLASSFIDVGRAASKSGKAMRAALISSGIGLAVALVGLLVEHWDDIVNFISDSNRKLQKQIDLGKERSEDLKFQLDILEIQKNILENQEKSTKEIEKIIKQTLAEQLLQAEANLELLNTQLKIEESKVFELSTWQKIQAAAGGLLGSITFLSEEEKKRLKELRAGVDDQTKGIENIRLKQSQIDKEKRDEQRKFVEEAKTERDKKFTEYLKENEEIKKRQELKAKGREDEQKEREEFQKLLNEEEQAEIEAEDRRLERQEKKFEEDAKNVEKQKALDQEIADSKQRLADVILTLTNQDTILGRAALLGKQALATKELLLDLGAIRSKATVTLAEASLDGAKSTSSVATGLSATLALGFPAAIPGLVAYAAAAAGIVTGVISAVKGTKKVASSLGASGGGSSPTPPRAPAPAFNLVQGTGSNQIAEGLALQNQPIKAFVVSSDVTTGQSLDRNIEENSSL